MKHSSPTAMSMAVAITNDFAVVTMSCHHGRTPEQGVL